MEPIRFAHGSPEDSRWGERTRIVYIADDSNMGASIMIRTSRFGVFVLAFGFAAAFTGLASPAAAQGTAAQREACEGDAFRFCSEFIPIVHMIENCLSRNLKKLTPACQIQMRGGAPVSRPRR